MTDRIDDSLAVFDPKAAFAVTLVGDTVREQIDNFQKFLEGHVADTGQKPDMKLREYWVKNPGQSGKGLYAREVTIPPGIWLVGKIHKTHHMNVMLYGDISLLTEFGHERLKGSHVLVCPPGSKRIGYAHTETRWMTVHATDEVDAAKIEADFISASHEEYDAFRASLKLLEG